MCIWKQGKVQMGITQMIQELENQTYEARYFQVLEEELGRRLGHYKC